MENLLTTGGGKIQCLRCTAQSTRTGLQCGRPALKTSSTQKCQFHGGRGSGPKTPEGKVRIAAAHRIHGNETRDARTRRAVSSAKLSRLEDAMYLLGMTSAPRSPGRKSKIYVPVVTTEDLWQMVLDDLMGPVGGSSRQPI